MSENKRIKMTLADGTVIEGTAEELAKLQRLFPSADASEEESSELVPGDYAKVIGPTYYRDISKGTIVKITDEKDSDGVYRIEVANTSEYDYDYAEPAALEKLEISESDELFLKNGRDIGEFKEGDIAEVLKSNSASPVGTLVEVTGKDDEFIRAKGWSALAGRVQDSYVYTPDKLKLIALAEKRADVDV